jgi:hypothetical protein
VKVIVPLRRARIFDQLTLPVLPVSFALRVMPAPEPTTRAPLIGFPLASLTMIDTVVAEKRFA